MPTKIEWCDEVWNPISGCDPCSPGCENCYAERFARRLAGRAGYSKYDPFRVTFHPERLGQPYEWKKPRKIFLCSMGDWMHPEVKDEWIDEILAIISANSRHTFLTLTKRPENLYKKLYKPVGGLMKTLFFKYGYGDVLPNLWLGVTVCNQKEADQKILEILKVQGFKKFVSIEPMLGEIKLGGFDCKTYRPWLDHIAQPKMIDAVILGGETGPGARPMRPDWVRSVRDQCKAAGVPFFFKGHGTAQMKKSDPDYHLLDGKKWEQFPKELDNGK